MPDGSIMLQEMERVSEFRVLSRDPLLSRLFARPQTLAKDRHPWLATFERAPEQGLSDLLGGYADLGPLGRLNPPEAIHALFGHLGDEDPARRSLAWAVAVWLDKRMRQPPPDEAPKRQRWISELQDVFATVHVLALVSPAVLLRRAVASWNLKVADLSLSPSRDARAGFWWMLALTQPIVARHAPDIDSSGLVPHWLDVCENAGSEFPGYYLDIGLMGLRRLPDSVTASVVPWMTGLAAWALAQQPTQDEFSDRWLGLKLQYPRTPEFWRDCVDEVLADPLFTERGIAAPAWWACDPALR